MTTREETSGRKGRNVKKEVKKALQGEKGRQEAKRKGKGREKKNMQEMKG